MRDDILAGSSALLVGTVRFVCRARLLSLAASSLLSFYRRNPTPSFNP